MASISGAWSAFALITGAVLATGCGESFFAGAGGSGASTSSGGVAGSTSSGGAAGSTSSGGAAGSTSSGGAAGGGGTTSSGDCTEGAKQSCYSGPADTEGVGVCKPGEQTCAQGVWGTCKGEVIPAAKEICNGHDDDCNGKADDGIASGGACQTPGCVGSILCSGGAMKCVLESTGNPEVCGDGMDNDCNGVVDPIPQVFITDAFGSGGDMWILDDEWSIGPAIPSVPSDVSFKGDPALDHSPNGDNQIAGVVLGGNASTTPHAGHYLTSKPIDLTQYAGSVVLSYWRWLNSGPAPAMVSDVQVFNGGAWLTLWQNVDDAGEGFPVSDGAWTRQVFDVTPYKDQQFRIRFGVTVNADPGGPPPIPVGSWNIDDVTLGNCY